MQAAAWQLHLCYSSEENNYPLNRCHACSCSCWSQDVPAVRESGDQMNAIDHNRYQSIFIHPSNRMMNAPAMAAMESCVSQIERMLINSSQHLQSILNV